MRYYTFVRIIAVPPTSSSCPTRTSSYMADPVMFSATTTGPDTPYTRPKRDSRSSSATFGRSRFAFWRAPAIVVVQGGGEERAVSRGTDCGELAKGG